MKAKKVMALMLCAAMVTSMSATAAFAAEEKEDAATEESADSTASEDPTAQFDGLKANEAYVFPMMVKSFQSTYWDAAQEGMKKASKELGVDYKPQGPNSESDIADQVNMINTAIASNPVGLGLAACDTSSVLDALKDCADKGIPVVTFDTGIADAPEGSVVCEVCTDNAQAGAVAAENMYNSIKDVVKDADGQVIIGEVNQDATAQNIQQRGTGFINKMIELLSGDEEQRSQAASLSLPKRKFQDLMDQLFSYTRKSIDRRSNEIIFYQDGERLLPYKLSSGEKQMLIILLTVLVRDNAHCVLFMDEPEASLHIEWQQKLISMIRELNPNVQLILTTHSPAVIMEGWLDAVTEVSDISVGINNERMKE